MADVAIVASQVASAPQDYKLPGAQEILLRAVGCTINGTNASGTFLPALQMLDPAGHVMWTSVNSAVPVAAGGSALVSWFPGGGVSSAVTSSSKSGGTISSLTSTAGTITVSAPSGPTTNVDLPNSGVTAGTYGDATHVAKVTVSADGIVTSASQVGISGISGTGLVLLFDTTLGAPAASIDTGVGGIASGHSVLIVYAIVQAATASVQRVGGIRFNNDSAANYDRQLQSAQNLTQTDAGQAANSAIISVIHGNSGSTSYPGIVSMVIPAYDSTTFWKVCQLSYGLVDATVANDLAAAYVQGWRNTAAISRMSIFDNGGGNLSTGSRLIIYGTQ